MSKRFHGISILACRVLSESKKPIIPSGRMRIEPQGITQIFDTFDGISFECPQLSEECPGIGIIGADLKRLDKLNRALIRPTVINKYIAENCVSHSIFWVK